ncbi:MAG: O-antigen polymerase [Eubacteriales bacterium]
MIIISRIIITDKLQRAIITLYLSWWTLWLGISTFNFYDLFPVSSYVYFLLILSVMMFCVGYLFCGMREKHIVDNRISRTFNLSTHSRFLYVALISFSIILYYYLKYRSVVQSGISTNNRMERFVVGHVFSSAKELLFFNYFIEPYIYAATIILAYLIIYGKFKNMIFWIIVLSVIFYAGIGSGRAPIIDVLIAMVLAFFIRMCDSKNKNMMENRINKGAVNTRHKKRNIIMLILISIVIIGYSAWLTAKRFGLNQFNLGSMEIGLNEFFMECIIYFTGPFRALEFGIANYPSKIGLLFGRGTFAGLDEIINLLFQILGITYNSATGIIGDLLQSNQIEIGSGYFFNFAYTNVMIHYFDFGVLGVIVFPCLYGFFVRKAVLLYEKRPSLPTLVILGFLFNTMINSVFKWGLQSPSAWILLIGSFIWYEFENRAIVKEKALCLPPP